MTIRHQQPAFSLLEVVVSLAAFSIIMLGTIQIFAQSTRSYKQTKVVQENLETIQFALNTIAKELRTSSIVASSVGAVTSTITLYDYSQGRCIQYQADETGGGSFSKRFRAFSNPDPNVNRVSCAAYTFSETYDPLFTGLTVQTWYIDPSTPMPNPHVGRVTIALTVGTASPASAQTTVSLRDFNYIGI